MDETNEIPPINTESKEKKYIPLPNLRKPPKFDKWLNTYIPNPFTGYEAKTHPDGTPYTRQEQVEATHAQIKDSVHFLRSTGAPLEDILKKIMGIARHQHEPKP